LLFEHDLFRKPLRDHALGLDAHDRRSLRSACIRAISDGPFRGDLVAGYWLWELPSIEDAVVWVKRCPNPMPEPWEIEIRPI